MDDLIGLGVATVRRRKRWTQEEAARHFRDHGLTTWRSGTVAQLEVGLRRLRIDEVVLICAAMEVPLEELLSVTDEPVELGNGATLPPWAIREYLQQGHTSEGRDPGDFPFPWERKAGEWLYRAVAEADRLKKLMEPIRQRAPWLTEDDVETALAAPEDAERHAARRLGIDPAQVRLAALALWRRSFTAERDGRIGDVTHLEPRSLQARRGLVARAMLADLRAYLEETADA